MVTVSPFIAAATASGSWSVGCSFAKTRVPQSVTSTAGSFTVTVERALDGGGEHALEERLRDGRVGREIAEHGCHVGVNHARALAASSDGVRTEAVGAELGHEVGGHDRPGEAVPALTDRGESGDA